jgi:hypothetical protein
VNPNWGECYFDHFGRFLGSPCDRSVFERNDGSPRIQLLAYDNVFPNCRVFATLGLSHYADVLGQVGELIVPVDQRWDEVPYAVASVLFHMVGSGIALGWGVAVEGVDCILPDFARFSKKVALYITLPFGMPKEFGEVSCGEEVGRVFVGFFITRAEFELFCDKGARVLERTLEEHRVDPYSVTRASAV